MITNLRQTLMTTLLLSIALICFMTPDVPLGAESTPSDATTIKARLSPPIAFIHTKLKDNEPWRQSVQIQDNYSGLFIHHFFTDCSGTKDRNHLQF